MSSATLSERFAGLSGPARCAVWMVLAGMAFSTMGGLIKFLAAYMHAFEVAFFRCFFGLLWMLPWLVRRGPTALRTRRFPLYLARGAFGVAGMLGGFYAVAHLDLADATALSFTAPLFATVGAALVLRERVRLRRWSATILGFIGVLVILRPGAGGEIDIAVVASLLGAATMAANMLIVKRLTDTEPTEAVVVWMVVLLAPMTLIAALPVWVWPEPWQWPYLAAMGLAGTLGHLAVTRGFKAADASLAMTFEYVRMPMSAGVGIVVFSERPTVWTFIGAGIVAASSAYIAHRESTLARRAVIEKEPDRKMPRL